MDRKRPAAAPPNDTEKAAADMAAFIRSLKTSLEKNRILQQTILKATLAVGKEIARNRRLASRLTRELYLETEGCEHAIPREFPTGDPPAVHNLLQSMAAGTDESASTPELQQQAKIQDAKLNRSKVKSNWSADPYRAWKRQYFVDPMGSIPKPNADTIKRRRMEEDHLKRSDAEHDLVPHLSPSWTKQEIKLMMDSIQEQNRQSNDGDIDYQAVADHVNAKRKPDADLPTRKPRTAKECQVQYQRQQAQKQPKLSKAEVQQVTQQVQEQQSKGNPIDWQVVAEKIGNKRTPFQCLAAHQKAKYSMPTQPIWTPQQDELLLKYIAAHGPQFVLDVTAVEEMCLRLFPDKTRRQVFLRANQSLVNPNLQSTPWSLQEERKLVLCQKIYKDASQRVPAHFPTRSSRSVREKWSRNLDPAYNKDKPFTPQEDEVLKEAVRQRLQETHQGKLTAANQCGSAISWSSIMKQHFPDRRSEHLRQRWIQELATEEEMLHKIKADLATQQGMGGGGRGSSQQDSASPLVLDDYVVQVVGSTKKHKRE